MPSSHEKTEMNSVLLEIDPVFMYQIGDTLKRCLKASEWDTSNPTWNGKLQIVEDPSNRRQVQFVNSNGIFGVVANKQPVESPMFQKVLDSNRYFTTEIKNTKSGKNEVIGIGFISRCDGSKLLNALDNYFASKRDGMTNDGPMKYNEKDQIKVEIKIEAPENSQVEVELNTLQKSQSNKGTHIRCHKDRCHADATTNKLDHIRKGQDQRAGPSHDEHNLENSILTRATESESTTDSNSEGETPCSIPKKMKIESQSQGQNELEINLMHIDAQEQSDSQDSVDSFNAVQEPTEECESISLSSEVLPNNKNGIFCLDPVTRELVCPFCGFNTHAKHDMKLLLSHWQKDGDMEAISTCSLCYIIFSTPEQRLKHINALHIKCDICSKEFKKKRKKLLELHMDSVHNCNNGQVERDDTALGEHNVEERILSSGGEGNNYYEKEEGEITSDDNSEEEAPCMISETEKIELHPRDKIKHEIELMLIDSSSEEKVGPETLDSAHTVQEPSGPCVHNFLPSEGLSGNNENGTFCLDPVTLQLICPLCGFKTYSKSDMKLLLSHWREDHDMTRHDICRFCFILFSTPEQRLSHLKVHNYVCAICLHEVKSKKQFLTHVLKWHKVKRGFALSPDIDNNHYTCNRCSKEFENENTKDLIDHFSLNNSATQCSSATTTVQEHETGSTYSRKISRRNQFICHLCPISKFSSFKLNDLLHHWQTEHDLRKPITCTFCRRIFLTEEQRLYHVIVLHTFCSVCSVEFGNPKSLDSHMERHSGIISNRNKERPEHTRYDQEPTAERILPRGDEDKYDAEEDEITIIDDNCVSHLNAHDFSCSICTLKFTEQNHLLRHLEIWHLKLRFRMSSNNNNYRCNLCSKEFENINGLMNHFRPIKTTQRSLLSSVTSADESITTTTIQEYENGINYSLQVDGKNQFVCHLCPTATFYALATRDLLEHWKTEHDLREPSTSTCRLCHLFFSTPEHRLHHINALHIMCTVCNKEFKKQRFRKLHMFKCINTHKRQEKRAGTTLDSGTGQPTGTQHKKGKNRCNRCSIEFSTSKEYRSHMISHHFVCLICSSVFTFQNQLDLHTKHSHPK